ncbi:MAG: hypothetical protein MJ179_01415 [Treponema sp.]|nr:hypothetical protein [Treponema sp.]
MTFSLFKILFSNMVSFDDVLANFKKGPKGIAKNLLIFLLFVYCFGVFGLLYVNTMLNMYNGLVAAGKTYIMPVAAVFVALVITFFFGFLSVATNYCTGSGEEQLLAMPLSAKQIFTAKFWISVVSDSIFGVLLLAVAAIIYGAKEGLFTKPGFYVGFIVSALTLCLVSIAVIFGLFVIILTFVPALRKKNIMQGVASFLVIIFAGFGGMIGSATGANVSSDALNLGNLLVNSSVGRLAETKAMQIFGNGLAGNWLSILVMAALSAFVIFVIVPLLAPLYIKTLNGFTDVKTKKIDAIEAEKVLKTELKSNSIFKTVFTRDIKTVLREPAFFANGPLLILILPLIMIVPVMFTLVSQGENLKVLGESLEYILHIESFKTTGTYYFSIGLSAFVTFMGNGTSLAATSFSREGKSLYDLKAMPIKNSTIVLAKFLHAFMYVIVGDITIIIFAIIIFAALGIPAEIIVLIPCFLRMILLSAVISVALIVGEMFLDTANPKLNWENPIAAVKQNVNSIISVFITLSVIIIFALLAFLILPQNDIGYAILVGVFIVIAVPLSLGYLKYAEKRLNTI